MLEANTALVPTISCVTASGVVANAAITVATIPVVMTARLVVRLGFTV